MESIKLSVQADHKFFTRASIFCRCVTNVKTLNVKTLIDAVDVKDSRIFDVNVKI